MGIDQPTCPRSATFGINRHHNTLIPKLIGRFIDKVRVKNGSGIDANFVGATKEHIPYIFQVANASADSHRHKAGGYRFFYDLTHGISLVAGGGNIEKNQFVRSLPFIRLSNLNGITSVP